MLDRNPFPGMNPWLEATWGNIHHKLISDLQDQIADQLPPGLFVTVEESVYLVHSDVERHQVRPDIAIVRRGQPRPVEQGSALAVAEPLLLTIPDEPITEGFIEIRALTEGHPVVTVVEVISPTNKLQRTARAAYLRKRSELFDARVSVMELDLIRRGQPIIAVPFDDLEPEQIAPYGCCIRPYGRASQGVEYYPLWLRQRLSRVPLPLRPNDDDLVLDLQQPIDAAYQRGRYGERIDYTKPPDPPLSPEDAAWAAEVIAAAQRDPKAS